MRNNIDFVINSTVFPHLLKSLRIVNDIAENCSESKEEARAVCWVSILIDEMEKHLNEEE